MTAETVRYSLERAIAEEGFCNYLLGGDVVGAAEFQEGNADHVAGISVEGETISIELTAPSATLPARLASPCATVVPAGTPVSEGQAGLLQPIASAGPYYVDTHAAGEQLVVLPNPNYAGTRSPQLDGIVFAVAGDPERAAVLVEQGRADLVADVGEESSPAFSFDGRLERQFGKEDCLSSTGEQPCFVRPPSNLIRFIQLDTRHGMLADPDVRRAFSLGLDRETLARLAQGYPITRLIGPGVPGHAPEPLVPAGGDAATARGLMDGRSATVRLGFLRFAEEDRRVASAIRDQLEPVGIRVVLEPSDDSFAEAVRPGTELTGLFAGWAPRLRGRGEHHLPGRLAALSRLLLPALVYERSAARRDRRGAHGRRPGTAAALAGDRRESRRRGCVRPPVHGLQLSPALLEPGRLSDLPAAVQRPRRPRLALPALTAPAATLAVTCPS